MCFVWDFATENLSLFMVDACLFSFYRTCKMKSCIILFKGLGDKNRSRCHVLTTKMINPMFFPLFHFSISNHNNINIMR